MRRARGGATTEAARTTGGTWRFVVDDPYAGSTWGRRRQASAASATAAVAAGAAGSGAYTRMLSAPAAAVPPAHTLTRRISPGAPTMPRNDVSCVSTTFGTDAEPRA